MQYCGPGEFNIRTSEKVNKICQKHDDDYQYYIDAGLKPYKAGNIADKYMLQELEYLAKTGYKFSFNDKLVIRTIQTKYGIQGTMKEPKRARSGSKITDYYAQRKARRNIRDYEDFISDEEADDPEDYEPEDEDDDQKEFMPRYHREGHAFENESALHAPIKAYKKFGDKWKKRRYRHRAMEKFIKNVTLYQPTQNYKNLVFGSIAGAVNTKGWTDFSVLDYSWFVSPLMANVQSRIDLEAGGTNKVNPAPNTNTNKLRHCIRIDHCNMRLHIRNNSLTACDMQLWEIIPKMDTNSTGGPASDWTIDLDNAVSDITNVPAANIVDMFYTHPLMSPYWNSRWKVIRKKKVRLEPGGEIDYVVSIGHRFMDIVGLQERQTAVGGSLRFMKGISKGLLISVQGTLVHDTTTVGDVGFGSFDLDYFQEWDCDFRYNPIDDTKNHRWYITTDALAAGNEQANQNMAMEVGP